MRRKDRQINESEAFEILEKGEYGILSTVTEEGEPYGIPLNYCVIDRTLYFHCAFDGKKVNILELHPNVSFCVVCDTEILPDKFSSKYKSCILQGVAQEVSGDEKHAALEGLLCKYSRNFLAEGKRYIEKLKEKTMVFGIVVTSISGKVRK